MSVSVVIPVFNAERFLRRCLDAVAASGHRPLEVIVVDDGSTDNSAGIARRLGARVLTVAGGPLGPAAARNLGAAHATGDILCFLDADTAVHPDAIGRLINTLTPQYEAAAAFGSYDATPQHSGVVSQYRNLLHHFVHQHASADAVTFWAGCGVVRRQVFLAVGGFDEHYRRASIEDIEFGGRLRAAGYHVQLRPDAQTTHLKSWTFLEVVRTDVRDRAIPWTRLILRQRHAPRTLNLNLGSRLSAAAAWITLGTAPLAWAYSWAFWIAVAGASLLMLLNAPLYAFFVRVRGLPFALLAAGLHVLYLLYSSAVFAVLSAGYRLSMVK